MIKWLTYLFDNNIPFEERASSCFHYQFENNEVYKRFCTALGYISNEISDIEAIPMLSVEAFKEISVITGDWETPEIIFKSSGTSAMNRSRHLVKSPELYKKAIFEGFGSFYGQEDWIILAYTPGYNDNPDSSLVRMLKWLIEADPTGLSRFLSIGKPLEQIFIDTLKTTGRKIMLFGAAFGLLDLIESGNVTLPSDAIIMETGGMKTHRREMSRSELHRRFAEGFGLNEKQVHSEYGMTELMSQAYSMGTEWFATPHWMKISIRDPENPLKTIPFGEEGLIGIIDLANIYSCSFLLTGDLGIMKPDETFKVLGRWKHSNLRGCNFLIDQD